MSNESLKVKGRLKVDFFRDGELVSEGEWRDNVVTDAGKAALASLLNSTSQGNTLVTHMGFGTATTPAVAASNTTLGAEISGSGYNRATYLVARTNPSANVIQYVATLSGLSGTVTVQEAGLFNASTGGTLFARQLTGAYTLAQAADSLQITWQISFP